MKFKGLLVDRCYAFTQNVKKSVYITQWIKTRSQGKRVI